ncbi:uncharacterized protein LOC135195327 [Macrobrachium nipponense]|uniref:uncharacterized protein LOC135195327 n=1 Tax=Macrobrachium nipponense TaxID=159736 RepID=UPI0030C7A1C6
MMGAHNSVASRFREQCPGIFVMKCVCHSAHLCASEACKALPRRCEDLAREIFNHFKCSSKRQSELVQFQEFLNLKPHKILHPSQTRWLSLVAVVVRLLEQWEALKMYFTDIWFSEKVVPAELIFHDLHNPFIKSYYLFLEWILPKFTNFNTYFQSDKTVITVLHEKLCMLYRELLLSFMEREYIMKTALESVDPFRQDRYLSDSEMYLGLGVRKELDKLNPNEHKSHLKEFYKRCRDFLVIACAEIKKRYDFKDNVISKLCCLTPENAISNSFRKSTPSLYSLIVELPLIVSPHDCSVIQKIDDQWRILPAFKDILQIDEILSVDNFWVKVLQSGDNFSELANFALCAATNCQDPACNAVLYDPLPAPMKNVGPTPANVPLPTRDDCFTGSEIPSRSRSLCTPEGEGTERTEDLHKTTLKKSSSSSARKSTTSYADAVKAKPSSSHSKSSRSKASKENARAPADPEKVTPVGVAGLSSFDPTTFSAGLLQQVGEMVGSLGTRFEQMFAQLSSTINQSGQSLQDLSNRVREHNDRFAGLTQAPQANSPVWQVTGPPTATSL